MAEAKPLYRKCIVPSCNINSNIYSGNDENIVSCALFGVPSNSLNAWQELIPNVKLKKTSRLCNLRFDDSDILKGYNILGVFHPFKRWRLSAGSNPKHHLEVGVKQPTAKKRAFQGVTNTNLPASTLQILENVPLTVNQPPTKRSFVRKLHITERRKVQQCVDHVAQELIKHTVKSQIDKSQQPQNDEAPGQMPHVQQTMAHVAQETIQHTVIPLVDQQADEQPQNEDAGHIPPSKISHSS